MVLEEEDAQIHSLVVGFYNSCLLPNKGCGVKLKLSIVFGFYAVAVDKQILVSSFLRFKISQAATLFSHTREGNH